jgi:hemoglobin/transferrin/lactoferrin receptor protein
MSGKGLRGQPSRRHALRLALLTSAMLTLSGGHFAVAQTTAPNSQGEARAINIPAGPLTAALNRFASQTGIQILFDAGLANGRTTRGVQGTMTPNQALSALLSGTSINYRYTGARTVALSLPGAQAGEAHADGSIQLDTIDVSGGRVSAQDRPFQTAGSSAYISQEEINRVPPTSTGDMFKDVPGVLAAGNRNGASVNVNIRGLQGMNRVNVMVDGTQQSTSTYRGYNGHDNRVYVDPELIGGISVEKGPSGGPYGAGAMGGVVNMRTIEARDVVKEGQTFGARLRGTWGSNALPVPATGTTKVRTENANLFGDETFLGSLAGGVVSKDVDFVFALARRKSGNYVAGTHGETTVRFEGKTERLSPFGLGQEVFNTSNDVTSSLVKGTVRLPGGHSLELGYINYENIFGEVAPTTTQFWERKQEPLARTETGTYTSKYRYNPGNDWIDFHANLWKANTDSKLPMSNLWQNTRSRNWGTELWNDAKTNTPIGELKLKTGFSHSDEFSSAVQETVGYVMEAYEGNRMISSGFAEADLQVTSWLGFYGSYRYDAYRLEGPIMDVVSRTPLPGGQFLSIIKVIGSREGEGDRWSPTAGVKVTPWEGIQFFGQYSEGFRPPSVREAFLGLGNANGISILPNPNLRPEVAKNYEVGVNVLRQNVLTDKDSLKIKVAYFDNTYHDFVVRMNGALVGIPGGDDSWGNIDRANFKGVETTLHYDAGYFFTDLTTNYYTDITYCYPKTSNPLLPVGCMSKTYGRDYGQDYIPPEYMVRLTAGVRLFDQKLTIGGRVTSFGERTVGAAAGGTTIMPTLWVPTNIYDIFGEYKFTDDIALNFSIENLLDTYYTDPLGVGRLPSPGLTGRIGMSAKF